MNFQCPNCHNNQGRFNSTFGILPCLDCQKRLDSLKKPGGQVEFTTESIKDQRRAYQNDIEQPHRKGQLNKKWLELYGKEKAKKMGFTDQEIAHASYVYDEDKYYGDKT